MITVVESSEEVTTGLPASLAGFEDQASFLIIANEEILSAAQSTWRRDGSFEGRSSISFAGQTMQTTVTIVPDSNGRWKEIVNRSPMGVRSSIREGISVTRTCKIRARFRSSMKAPELLEPNRIYQYSIDLWHTGISIPIGARLRVEIASAAFPLFSRNLNTGGHNETETNYVSAHQTIYHDLQRPSHILLPVILEQ